MFPDRWGHRLLRTAQGVPAPEEQAAHDGYNRIVGMRGEKLVDYPVDEALEMTKTLDPVLLDVCNTISI